MSGHYYTPTRRRTAVAVGLNAALIGTGLNVLRFNVATLSGTGLSIANTAADGTTITVTKRGLWGVHLYAQVPAQGGAAFGISLAAPATALQAADNPLPATAAFTNNSLLAGAAATAPAATVIPVSLYAIAVVSQDDIAAGNNVIRLHGNDGAGMALADADIDQTEAHYRVTWLGDLKGA